MKAYIPNLKKMPLSTIFSALGDPVRLEIIQTLLKNKEIACGECSKRVVSKSTMSHHFKVLIGAGLIQKRELGTTHYLSLRQEEIEGRLPGLLGALREKRSPL